MRAFGRRPGPARWVPRLFGGVLLLALAACGGPKAIHVDLDGRVQGFDGAPLAGVLVHAGDELTTTDAYGAFAIADVPVPYTLTVASTAGEPWAHAFAALTSATPVVVPMRVPSPPPMSASVGGTVYGGNPVPIGVRVSLCAEGLDVEVIGCAFVDAGETHYALPVFWSGSAQAQVRVHGLWMEVDGDDRPTGYDGVASAEVSVTDGGSFTRDLNRSFFLVDGPTVPVTVHAEGGTIGIVVVAVALGPRLVHTVATGPWPGGTVEVALPPTDVAPTVQVTAFVEYPVDLVAGAWVVAPSGTSIEFDVPPPPQLVAPAEGAAGVDGGTQFRAVAGGAVARQFSWRATGTTVGPSVVLTTPNESATLPDLSAVGLGYPAGGTYLWNATAIAAADYAAALRFAVDFYDLIGFGGSGKDGDVGFALSAARELTLAP